MLEPKIIHEYTCGKCGKPYQIPVQDPNNPPHLPNAIFRTTLDPTNLQVEVTAQDWSVASFNNFVFPNCNISSCLLNQEIMEAQAELYFTNLINVHLCDECAAPYHQRYIEAMATFQELGKEMGAEFTVSY